MPAAEERKRRLPNTVSTAYSMLLCLPLAPSDPSDQETYPAAALVGALVSALAFRLDVAATRISAPAFDASGVIIVELLPAVVSAQPSAQTLAVSAGIEFADASPTDQPFLGVPELQAALDTRSELVSALGVAHSVANAASAQPNPAKADPVVEASKWGISSLSAGAGEEGVLTHLFHASTHVLAAAVATLSSLSLLQAALLLLLLLLLLCVCRCVRRRQRRRHVHALSRYECHVARAESASLLGAAVA